MLTTQAIPAQGASQERPRGRQPAAGGALSLTANVLLPVLGYYGLRALGVGQLTSLLLTMTPPAALVVGTAIRRRQVEPLSVLVLVGMSVSLVSAVAGGSPRHLLVRGAWLSAPLSLWTLATLWVSPRPVTFSATQALLPFKAGLMEQLWRAQPLFRRAWREITVLWGVVALVDAALRVVIAYALPVDVVPVLEVVITVVTVVALQVPTHLLLRRSGHWHQLFAGRTAER